MPSPVLTGVDSPTFFENTVNATPQQIDSDVTLTDSDEDLANGVVIVSGLLAPDRVSVLNGGPINFDAGTGEIFFGGLLIGVATGGAGADLRILLNANATTSMVESLIEQLSYATVSNTPPATHNLIITVVDGAGESTDGAPSFVERAGSLNPVDSLSGDRTTPTFGDVDGDGDMDAVLSVANVDGVRYFENTGSVATPIYSERVGGANPFSAVTGLLSGSSSGLAGPLLADFDADGDIDLIVGTQTGTVQYWRNTGTPDSPVYAHVTGSENLFGAVFGSLEARPALADMDNDGDLDLLLGHSNGSLTYYENTGSTATPLYVNTTNASPFNGVGTSYNAKPALADVDGDGDIDLILGNNYGDILYWANTGSPDAAVFVSQGGGLNPFSGVTTDQNTSPTFVDMDGDGDLDLVTAGDYGSLVYVENTTPRGVTVAIGVIAESDGSTPAPDVITGTPGNDTIDGQAGDDTIDGGAGDDYLKGGAGDDAMSGGTGNDTYVVDSFGDTTDETGGEGVDIVLSRIDWTLAASIENLTLGAGGLNIDGTGNALNNVITGNDFVNVLTGLDGADTLYGKGRDDVLNGGAGDDILDGGLQNDILYGGTDNDHLIGGGGNDALDGGTGVDVMEGGAGHDSYVVDDTLDTVTEGLNGGTDTVVTSATFTLGANVENLTLSGTVAIDGDGNGLRNIITGNGAANVLSGGGEIDTLSGASGDDFLFGDDGNDILSGGADQDGLQGGNGLDTLGGGAGDDVLSGGAGGDKLTGGTGADVFRFTDLDIHLTASAGVADRDTLLDLIFADGDRIDLSGIDAIVGNGASNDAFVWAAGNRFGKHAGEATLKYVASTNITTLELDVDGDGQADFRLAITGDHSGSTTNLYTGAGDANGGWLL